MSGILYVVYNEAIRDPETNERLYKIGITKNTVSDRFYGLGLKMPGKFETLFAYKLDDYARAEQLIHGILDKYRDKGEWFKLEEKELEYIKNTCEIMGGILATDAEINSLKYNDTPKVNLSTVNNISSSIKKQSLDVMNDFLDKYYSKLPHTFQRWLGKRTETKLNKLNKIRDTYILSFDQDLFDIERNLIQNIIKDIDNNMEKRFEVNNTAFAVYNKKNQNGIPQSIISKWYIMYLKELSCNNNENNIAEDQLSIPTETEFDAFLDKSNSNNFASIEYHGIKLETQPYINHLDMNKNEYIDTMQNFIDWFKPQIPSGYKSWLGSKLNKIGDIRQYYKKSFNEDLFNIKTNSIHNIIENIRENMSRRFIVDDKSFAEFNKKSSNGIPQAILSKWYIKYLEDTYLNKNNKSVINNQDIVNTYKPIVNKVAILPQEEKQKESNPNNQHLSEQPDIITRRIMKTIREINKICTYNNKRKIFIPETFELSDELENICNTENDFKNFTANLYIILREHTRYKNPARKPPYDYMLPSEFMKDNTSTRHFWDNVNKLRNGYFHSGNSDIADVFEEYLGNRNGPEKNEDFHILQNKLLTDFEKSIIILRDMIRNDPGCLR